MSSSTKADEGNVFLQHDETIYALSTPPGKSGLAIVRCSGPSALTISKELTEKSFIPRHATLVHIRNRQTEELIDQGIVIEFPAPASATGEDLVEFHIHGSRAVIQALIDAIRSFPKTRSAEPGEFTRRAFENGKMDFTQIEGLVDLIEAETSAQRLQALAGMDGRLSRTVAKWRSQLLEANAHFEACFDFSDEGEIDQAVEDRVGHLLTALRKEMDAVLSRPNSGPIIRSGITVAIVGPPNVGKSSLFNWMAGSDLAIVSPIAGTTRDALNFTANLGGMAVTFFDTAGMRQSNNEIEIEGIQRAQNIAANAELILNVMSPETDWQDSPLIPQSRHEWKICNKIDQYDQLHMAATKVEARHQISCITGQGIPELISDLTSFAMDHVPQEPALLTRERHQSCLKDALAEIDHFLSASDDISDIRAECLRRAVQAFGKLTGTIDAEELLGVIFSEYCIGK